MRITRRIRFISLAAALTITLQAGFARAQLGGGTPGSGDACMHTPGATIESSYRGSFASYRLLASTSLRMMLSRWFSIPVNAPGVSGRRLMIVGR